MGKNKEEGLSIPKLKKKISSFLIGEEGKISKESLLKIGVTLSGAALTSAIAVPKVSAWQAHDNGFNMMTYDPGAGVIGATHAHHNEHGVGGPCNW